MASHESHLETLASLLWLEEGWDGYDAEPPSHGAIDDASRLLHAASRMGMTPSRVAPSVVGGVGVTFRAGHRRAYVEYRNGWWLAFVLFSDGVGEPRSGEYRDRVAMLLEVASYLDGS